MAERPNWTAGGAKDLPVIERTAWDAGQAKQRVFTWAGWPDNPKPGLARQAFLIYDTGNAGNRGAYKLPFADVSGGKLVAVLGGLRAAASRLPQTDAPPAVQDKARRVLDSYFERLRKAIRLSHQHEQLHKTINAFGGQDTYSATVMEWAHNSHNMLVAEMDMVGLDHNNHGPPVPTTKAADERVSVPIIKAEKHLAYGVVLKPGVPDSQGDIITPDDIERAAHNWMKRSRIYDHQHQTTLWEGEAIPVESWIAPFDLTPELGWPKYTPKGSWILTSYIPDPVIWEQVKTGKVKAYSIRGWGKRRRLA